MTNEVNINSLGRQESAKSASRGGRHSRTRRGLGGEDFAAVDSAIAEGAISVFAEIRVPPCEAQSELIDMKILLPAKWSSELLEQIEGCIDKFTEEKGIGKTKIVDEGTPG